MPYFIYEVYPNKTLNLIKTFEKYPEAKAFTREVRSALMPTDSHSVRLIHAQHEHEAERLLSLTREPRPMGEEN